MKNENANIAASIEIIHRERSLISRAEQPEQWLSKPHLRAIAQPHRTYIKYKVYKMYNGPSISREFISRLRPRAQD